MSDTLRILKEARSLISEPECWTQGDYARDGDCPRTRVAVGSLFARCFCAIGAIARVSKVRPDVAENSPAAVELAALNGLDGPWDIVDFNDEHSHAEVLALFDRAISLSSIQEN